MVLQTFFGATSLKIIYVRFGATFVGYNCKSGFFAKECQISEKNQSNRSLYEGDIADLKSALFLEIFVTVGQL